MARDLGEAIEILKEHGLDFARIVRDTHAQTTLRVGTLLDETLEIALSAHFLKKGKPFTAKTFQKGKLSKLSGKIKRAKDEGILDDEAFSDADILRKLRNEFGHLKSKLHFDSPAIEELAKRLSTYDAAKTNQEAIFAAHSKVTEKLRKVVPRVQPKSR